MYFPGDPASLSNRTIPGPSLALLRQETVAWFTFSLGWPRRGMFCFPQNTMWCTSDFSFSSFSLCFTSEALSRNQQLQDSNQPQLTGTDGTLSRCPGRFSLCLAPQCGGFLLDGQRQSSKLSLIADRHDKSQVVSYLGSIEAVRQRKDATELAVFFHFFRAFPATFQWQTACKSDLRVFSWGLHSAKIRKTALGSNDLSTGSL